MATRLCCKPSSAGRKVAQIVNFGSSLKFCRIAEGQADLYPRFGRTMEWDTCAPHAVVVAAGGSVETLDGRPLLYGKPGLGQSAFRVPGRAVLVKLRAIWLTLV